MKVELLCFDSMGVRSMATYVKTGDVRIMIDPSAALAPRRFGLPPHPLELSRLEDMWRIIVKYSEMSDVMIITHYHYDHHSPHRNLEIYEGKTLIVKHPVEKINWSQRRRSSYFLDLISGLPKSIDYADNKSYEFGNTKIVFSEPVPHGSNDRLGYVVEVLIDNGKEKFLFTSDIEGAPLKSQVDFILDSKPNIIVMDGPMTYMLGYRYSHETLRNAINNMKRIMEIEELKDLILDHHLLRELEWRERIAEIIELGREVGVRVRCAAEFSGKELNLLEAMRRSLYEEERE